MVAIIANKTASKESNNVLLLMGFRPEVKLLRQIHRRNNKRLRLSMCHDVSNKNVEFITFFHTKARRKIYWFCRNAEVNNFCLSCPQLLLVMTIWSEAISKTILCCITHHYLLQLLSILILKILGYLIFKNIFILSFFLL